MFFITGTFDTLARVFDTTTILIKTILIMTILIKTILIKTILIMTILIETILILTILIKTIPGYTKGGSITVPLTSCLTGLQSVV
jgi:hypothetical protein